MEATFTPAPDKDTGSTDGPLPQSQRQREQLMQLYQQISTSPNPQEMLQKVAEANNMSAEQLGDILMRNVRDMEMASGGGGNGGMMDSLPRKMIRLLSTLVLMLLRSASAHPRSAMMTTVVFMSILYVLILAPRNGIVISRSRGLFSSGPTTVIAPPISYLQKLVDSPKFEKLSSSMGSNVKVGSLSRLFESEETTMGESKDGIHIVSLSKKHKKNFSLIATATKKIPFEILLPSEEELELLHAKEKEKKNSKHMKSEDLMAKVEEDAWAESITLAMQSAQNVIDARRFSEFVSGSSNSLRFYSSQHDHDKAVLVMKKMGDLKRFGIQPLRVAYEEDGEHSKCVSYYTVAGGHFDGEIKVSVQRTDDESSDGPSVIISVSLLIPKNGRQINKKMASEMLLNIAESITKSTMTSARQTLSRRLQSTIYRGRAMNRASEKRTMAFDNVQKMEEMAAERKRRWARSNPNAGSYRPSGDMHRLQGRPSRSF